MIAYSKEQQRKFSEKMLLKKEIETGAPNEDIVQNHLT